MGHRLDGVRRSTVEAFTKIIHRGDACTISVVAAHVKHDEEVIRFEAMKALETLAELGHE